MKKGTLTSTIKLPAPALDKGLDVLEFLALCERGETTQVLAQKLNIPQASAFRIIQTLIERGYVRKEPGSSRVRLGPRIHLLSKTPFSSTDYVSVAAPFMERLRSSTRMSVELTHYSNDEIDFIDLLEADEPISYLRKKGAPLIGPTNPVTLTVLAHLALPARQRLLKRMDALRKRYVKVNPDARRVSVSGLPEESMLLRVCEESVASDFGMQTPKVSRIASPVFGLHDSIIGTLGIIGSTNLLTEKNSPAFTKHVISEAKRLSAQLTNAYPRS